MELTTLRHSTYVRGFPIACKSIGKLTLLSNKEQKSLGPSEALFSVIPSPMVVFEMVVSRVFMDTLPLVMPETSIPVAKFPVNKLLAMVSGFSNVSSCAPIIVSLTRTFRSSGDAAVDFIPMNALTTSTCSIWDNFAACSLTNSIPSQYSFDATCVGHSV